MGFRERVLELVEKIPKGKVTTYKHIAQAMGKPKASRAVGNALAKNPRPIEIPCHRVVKSNGKIGNYARGKKKKKELLEREGVKIENQEIDLEKYLYKNLESSHNKT